MLTHLNIQGLAIIETLAIDFSSGFNVITGETGAGKSILIKALNLLLGAKASPDAVRKGSDSAVISATFEVDPKHPVVEAMTDLGIPFEKGSNVSCMVRRRVSINAKTQGWINDVPVTLSTLREVGSRLVDIFAQNENHRLLDANNHTEYLDKFLSDPSAQSRVESLYDECYGGLKRIFSLVETYKTSFKDQDYFSFRIDELNTFAPDVEDFTKITETCNKAEKQQAIQGTLNQIQTMLDEGADGRPISKQLRDISKLLYSIKNYDEVFEEVSSEASNVASMIDDISYKLNTSGLDFGDNGVDLASLQDRLGEYQSFFRKFSVQSVDELVVEKHRMEEFLNSIDTQRLDIESLIDHLYICVSKLKNEATLLSELRKDAVNILKTVVEAELHELAMPNARFDCEMSPISSVRSSIDFSILNDKYQRKLAEIFEVLSEINANGMEKICFMLAANKGEPLLALHKTASGGELSRIMLALKRAISSGADTCVLIFDEIDTGISGKVADIVGRKLKDLSHKFQVFCISHLPQVAVYADTHFLVQKNETSSRTETNIIKLSESDRAKEIARLLSGDSITQPSLQNAKNLISKARSI